MARYGDEMGMLWENPPVIKPPKGTKKVDFNPNIAVKDNYVPPERYKSILGLKRLGLDIETKDPDLKAKGPSMYRGGGKVVGIALAENPESGQYYPTAHANTDRCMQNPERFWNELREDAKKFDGEIITAKGIYDLDWLQKEHDIRFPKATIRDVQIAEGLLDENRFTYNLDALGNEYLGEGKATDVLKNLYGSDYISHMDEVDPGHASDYGIRDACMTMEVFEHQQEPLTFQDMHNLHNLESRLVPLLLQMREVGVRVDIDAAEMALLNIQDEVAKGREELRQMAGSPIDVFSAQTIARACDHLSIDYPRTKAGNPSFVKSWLESHESEFLRKVCDQRGYEKIGGTFVQNYILDGHVNGRIHCQFNQLKGTDKGARTGRFSSSNPNLQNIPTRHPTLGKIIRSLFIPEEGCEWGGADWSQIEYRLLVHYASRTPGIDASKALRMYLDDPKTDFHQMAAEITGKSRKVAKNINFGVVYGMGIALMAASLGVSYNEANQILNEFHGRSPFMKEMLNTAGARAQARGHITTMLGRRRRFTAWEYAGNIFQDEASCRDYAAKNPRRGKFCQLAQTHKALNALLQGSAADMMKLAMVECYEAGVFEILKPHLTVHDEMNVSVPPGKMGDQAFAEMIHIMENCMKLAVPVLVDAKRGMSWAETK